MNIQIEKAIPRQAELVAEVGRRTFYETWKSVNTEEDLQLYMKKAFDPELIRKELGNDSVYQFLLAHAGEELAGYVKLRNDRFYQELGSGPALELERIYVFRTFHGTGVGVALMDRCIAIARKGSYRRLWLGVNQENVRAIEFYKKYGFTIFGTKQFQLGNAVDEDFLMKLELGATGVSGR